MNKISITALMAALLLPMTASADLDGPGTVGSNMPTTTQIYNLLNTGTAIPAPVTGTFIEPGAGPAAGDRKTLAEIQAKLPVPDAGGAAAGDVLIGKSFWSLLSGAWGLQSGTMPNKGAANFTPGASAVPVPAGYYSGGQVNTDANLRSDNIKSGATIFGVAGSTIVMDTSTGTASAGDILSGKKAFANGSLVTGTLFVPAIAKRVNRTGQTTIHATGDDGQYQYGIDPAIAPTGGVTGAYNSPSSTGTRFIDNGDGTVTDTLTTLIWLKNGTCLGQQTWANALTVANALDAATAPVACSLNDGSTAGQWRLPNINELHSLGPTWPLGAPFASGSFFYWSSTTHAVDTGYAWYISFSDGNVTAVGGLKSASANVRYVRGGQ